MPGDRRAWRDGIAEALQPVRVGRLQVQRDGILPAVTEDSAIGCEKAEPVGFLIGINHLEVVTFRLSGVRVWPT